MLKFKKGDTVKVLLGKDKGREGKIETVLPKKGKVVVEGINIYKKHVKGQQGQKGGIYEIPRSMPFGKIMLVCPKCKKTARVGFRLAGKEKTRFCKKCDKSIDIKS